MISLKPILEALELAYSWLDECTPDVDIELIKKAIDHLKLRVKAEEEVDLI